MDKNRKRKLKAYEDLRGEVVAYRVLTRELKRRLSRQLFENRALRSRLNDYEHLTKVEGLKCATLD